MTDANVVLGRLISDATLADDVALDAYAAAAAIDRLTPAESRSKEARLRAAAGVVAVADAHMERALRVITLERGYDPRDFTLVAFGGAGPLHGCALAERLEIDRVLVPRYPGVLSALGALGGEHVREYAATVLRPATAASERVLTGAFSRLERTARRDFAGAGRPRLRRLLDLRYVGQSYELTVPLRGRNIAGAVRAFHKRHHERYAHSRPDAAVEIVVVRLNGSVKQPPLPEVRPPTGGRPQGAANLGSRRWHGQARPGVPAGRPTGWFRARGPLLVVQDDATTWAPPGWRAEVDQQAALVLERN